MNNPSITAASEVIRSTAVHLYPNWDGKTPITDYRPIIHHLGNVIAIEASLDFSGIAYVAYETTDPTKISVLFFLFGCCIACDRLSACTNYQQIDQVIEQMSQAIKIYDRVTLSLVLESELTWMRLGELQYREVLQRFVSVFSTS